MKIKGIIAAAVAVTALLLFMTHMAESKKKRPDKLDNAAVGSQASAGNPFFGNVLTHPETDSRWKKISEYEYQGPTGRKYVFDPDAGTFTETTGTTTVSGNIQLPAELQTFLDGKPILSSIQYASLGLSPDAELNYTYNANGKLEYIKDADGNNLIRIAYDGNNIMSITDFKNRTMVEYNTTDSFISKESEVYKRGSRFYYRELPAVKISSGMLGKVTNVYMTDSTGVALTGSSMPNGRICYFGDNSPVVSMYGSAYEYDHSNYHQSQKISLVEMRYNPDGSLKNMRFNNFTSGQFSGSRYAGQYASRIDTFDAQGNRTSKYYNDPAPKSFEPTFTGTLVKDQYGKYYVSNITSAIDDKGKTMNLSTLKSAYQLTTRETSTDYQPSSESRVVAESATRGGAQEFTDQAAAVGGWDSLIGKPITVQGQLMSKEVSNTGVYYGGEQIGVFSAFDIR